MEKSSEGDQTGVELPMEPLESQVPGLERPQDPAEERRPESPKSSSVVAVQEATGVGQGLSGGKKLPSPRPARLRVMAPSLGYGAFRRQASGGPEPASPGPAAAEQPRNGEATGAELVPWAAPREPATGTWAPMELQVDVRVKPVSAAGSSRGSSLAPSPAPSTRFVTVPVPESPAFSRQASPTYPFLPRTASLGSTWGWGSQLAAARAEHGSDAEGRTNPADWGGESPGASSCRCRCNELEKDDAALLRCAEVTGDRKLHPAIKLIGLPMYMKSLRWALVIMAMLLAVSTVAIVALASRTGTRCRPCSQGWLWSGEHCYFLSPKTQAWEDSQAFCSAHQATLPLLSHTQDFLSRYPVTKFSWVGAQRGPQGWQWIDGTPVPPELLPEEDEDQPDLKCGGLEEGRLVALDCASSRSWVCARETK
ncbi:killer cell lectin-like receptor subfamily G member 2 [Rhynchonycteris naso]